LNSRRDRASGDFARPLRRRLIPEFAMPYPTSGIGDIPAASERNRAEHQNRKTKPN
jgi:hypothetical protein